MVEETVVLVLLKVRDLVMQIMEILVEILTGSDTKPMVVVEVEDQEQVTTLKMVDLVVVLDHQVEILNGVFQTKAHMDQIM